MGRKVVVTADAPERTPFLDWARSQQAAKREPATAPAPAGPRVETRSMAARRLFLHGLDDDEDPPRERAKTASRHTASARFPFAHPGKIVWSSDLHHGSHSIQEQVNFSIASAKHISEAEREIRPRCRIEV